MLWSLLTAAAMGVMAIVMINRARFARTRRMALLPLACLAVELLMTGVLDHGRFPALTAVLAATRVVILLCCVGTLREDARAARRKDRRRARLQRAEAVRPSPRLVPLAERKPTERYCA